jgi:hypothetical protein
MDDHGDVIYDSPEHGARQRVDLEEYPLIDDDGLEIPVYDHEGKQILRRKAYANPVTGQCGVLMDLKNIQALFNPDNSSLTLDNDFLGPGLFPREAYSVNVQAFPIGFLKVAGNVKATGIPHCFYPGLTEVNKSVRKNPNRPPSISDDGSPSTDTSAHSAGASPVVKPIVSQFYNYFAHRATARAAGLDSQQGLVTAALSGAFAQTVKDKKTASNKQASCEDGLPSARFHQRISRPDCPKCCRAEVVYTVDVRSLKNNSGRKVSSFSSPTSLAYQSSTGSYSKISSFRLQDHGRILQFAMSSKIIL